MLERDFSFADGQFAVVNDIISVDSSEHCILKFAGFRVEFLRHICKIGAVRNLRRHGDGRLCRTGGEAACSLWWKVTRAVRIFRL
jgi:hypothetical protein